MSPAQADKIYRTRDEIIDEMVTALLFRVPDAHVGLDSLFRVVIEIVAHAVEGDYLAQQLLLNDIWPQTSDTVALMRHGDEFAFLILPGTASTGTVRFTGAATTVIPVGSVVAAVVLGQDVVRFQTTEEVVVPNPGTPSAPVWASTTGGGSISGTMQWAYSYVTGAGETLIGPASDPVVLTSATDAHLTGITAGGPGTIQRRLYRSVDGGPFKLAKVIDDNTTTTAIDNVANGSLGSVAPSESLAERVSAAAEATKVGVDTNVAAGTVTTLVNVPGGITDVSNPADFTGGTDPQDIEDYRQKLVEFIQDPQSGSPRDLKAWSEQVEGVQQATVFVNKDGTLTKQGHNTIRISGPDGIIPDADVIAAVVQKLLDEDLANVHNHVTTFTPNPIDVDVDVTLGDGYTLGQVTPEVEEAVANYINLTPVAETVYVSGIVDAVFGLVGVVDVDVTTPSSNVTSAATEKPTVGTVTVGTI